MSAGCHQVGSDKNRLTLSRLSNGSDGTRFEGRHCSLSFKAILNRPECHLLGIVLALIKLPLFAPIIQPSVRPLQIHAIKTSFAWKLRKSTLPDPRTKNHVASIMPFSATLLETMSPGAGYGRSCLVRMESRSGAGVGQRTWTGNRNGTPLAQLDSTPPPESQGDNDR